MPRGELSNEPTDIPELVADAAMEAAKRAAEHHGVTLENMLVMLNLDGVPEGAVSGATAAHGEQYEGDGAGVALAAELLTRAKQVLNAMGKDIEIVPMNVPMGGQG